MTHPSVPLAGHADLDDEILPSNDRFSNFDSFFCGSEKRCVVWILADYLYPGLAF